MAILSPTPYEEVNAVLSELLRGVRAIIGEAFVGMYLYGSLASGDFDLRSSDIDFLVLTTDNLPERLFAELEKMHGALWTKGGKWARKLEGCYVPSRIIYRPDPNAAACPTVNEGKIYMAPLGADWVFQRRILREQGVILAGPTLQDLIAPVTSDEVRQAVRDLLDEWWRPMLADPALLRRSEYCTYAVLSMCRCLYTLEHGVIASKPVSARWAREKLDGKWAVVIDKALAWTDGMPPVSLEEAREFIRLVCANGNLDVNSGPSLKR